MATASQALTLAQFEAEYAHEKPYYEFWYGEAVQKSMANWIHGLLQGIIMELLRRAGYEAGSEVTLKIESGFHPIPDIIATSGRIEIPYPTKAVEIIVEILSDADPMARVLTKCRAYQKWGFQQIYVVDPGARVVLRWSEYRLEEVGQIAGQPITLLWTAVDKAIQ